MNSRKGFMLLEVIQSIIVIASCVTVVIRSYTASLRLSKTAMAIAKACMLLEERIFDLDLKGFTKGVKEQEAMDPIEGHPGYQWSLSSYIFGPKEKGLNELDMSVAYNVGGIKGKVNIATFRRSNEL
jgi:Tfp pilus assembly protein PilE